MFVPDDELRVGPEGGPPEALKGTHGGEGRRTVFRFNSMV
jgi:hypothetical protein